MTLSTSDQPQAQSDAPQAQARITIPNSQPMVALVGASDEYLRLVESGFPQADILLRGNEITITGSPHDVGLIETLFGEMLTLLRTGQALTGESVELTPPDDADQPSEFSAISEVDEVDFSQFSYQDPNSVLTPSSVHSRSLLPIHTE